MFCSRKFEEIIYECLGEKKNSVVNGNHLSVWWALIKKGEECRPFSEGCILYALLCIAEAAITISNAHKKTIITTWFNNMNQRKAEKITAGSSVIGNPVIYGVLYCDETYQNVSRGANTDLSFAKPRLWERLCTSHDYQPSFLPSSLRTTAKGSFVTKRLYWLHGGVWGFKHLQNCQDIKYHSCRTK
jgi:hypothetical protein